MCSPLSQGEQAPCHGLRGLRVRGKPFIYREIEARVRGDVPGSATGMLSICGQCATLPAACLWHRAVSCSSQLSPSLCLATLPHPSAGTAGVGMALALPDSCRRQWLEDACLVRQADWVSVTQREALVPAAHWREFAGCCTHGPVLRVKVTRPSWGHSRLSRGAWRILVCGWLSA
jgi:hypothetical protein